MPPRGSFGRRMDKEWNAILASSTNLAANGTASGAGLTPGTSATVLRMIGEYVVGARLAPTAVDSAVISLGIAVVSNDAFIAGAASLPDPGGDPEFPWLFWASHMLFFPTTSADPSTALSSVRRSFDIRSMRKMKPSETLVSVIEYGNIIGNPDIQINMGATRVLLGGI